MLLPFMFKLLLCFLGFPSDISGKEPTCQCRRHWYANLIPGSGRLYGGEHGNILQYSCLENPIDRWAWWATAHRVAKSWTLLNQLCMHANHPFFNVFLCFLNVKSVKNSLISFGFLNNLFIFNGYIIFNIKRCSLIFKSCILKN